MNTLDASAKPQFIHSGTYEEITAAFGLTASARPVRGEPHVSEMSAYTGPVHLAGQATRGALLTLLEELLHGPASEPGGVLNPGDPGLLRSLAKLSAGQASAAPPNGGASIAAHVDHLRYGLELLNRWIGGENAFENANFSASWQRNTVTEDEWQALVPALQMQAEAWSEALRNHGSDDPSRDETTILASVVHLAYHVGAIRQIDRVTRGPAAED